MPLTLMSPAFADRDPIPEKHTRDGENISPPLKWTGVPEGTRSFVLIVEDPDAPSGTFRHWGLFNIPPDRDNLPESVETGPDKATLHICGNDFGNTYYDGPEPPAGHGPHRYYFRLAALDVPDINLPSVAGIAELWREVEKHKLDEATLIGVYER
ncbi:YbhB/YbcL family Raf kinase inhibitor-like protein [Chelativorans sp. YIM 93263]|uniref:YbhB/YbcL family Raf kinase inhibitor-like protein n=1 Tax=Chelativorans sp. YIM 93263 TaxID=2906648 RepID=UPI002378E8DC|nr:YbhB/YbcL family Raf kinase inhibitor-like protein [Chelativorans sp. YIM 93263]